MVFSIHKESLCVVLDQPSDRSDLYALPNRLVTEDESLDKVVNRFLFESFSLEENDVHLIDQIGTIETSDPRVSTGELSVCYFAIASDLRKLSSDFELTRSEMVPADKLDTLILKPSDKRMLDEALDRTRSLLEYTTFAARFLKSPFTVSQLREVYESVWGIEVDAGNFRRNIERCGGFVQTETPQNTMKPSQRRRPAARLGRRQLGRYPVKITSNPRGRPASYWQVIQSGDENQSDVLLTHALASRERGSSMLGIRTRSAMKSKISTPNRTVFQDKSSMSRDRLRFKRLPGGVYQVRIDGQKEVLGTVKRHSERVWLIPSLTGNGRRFSTRSDAAFYLWVQRDSEHAKKPK